jgi:hypothetical protein
MGQNGVGSSYSMRSLYALRRCDTRPRLATARVGASCLCVGGKSALFTNVPWKRKLNRDLTLTCCSCLLGCDFWIGNCARLVLIPIVLSWDFRTRVTLTSHQHGYLAACVRGIDIRGFQSGGLGSVIWQTISDLHRMQCPWDSFLWSVTALPAPVRGLDGACILAGASNGHILALPHKNKNESQGRFVIAVV